LANYIISYLKAIIINPDRHAFFDSLTPCYNSAPMTNYGTRLKEAGLLARLIGSGLALAALSLYLATLAPTVLEADAGEFQFVAWLPGIAHPTGYPLYVLLGWLWSHLFGLGDVAWRMNLLSAVIAGGTVGLSYTAVRLLLALTLPESPPPGRIMAAILAAVLFAVSPTFWSQAIIAEVYALHTCFVVLILWLALKYRRLEGHHRVRLGKWLALVIGLSLTHHRTIVLLLPGLILFGWYHHRPKAAGRHEVIARAGISSKELVIYGLLLIMPLCLYLYIPLIAPSTPYASLELSHTQTLTLYENSLRGFWDHIMGTVFTGDLQPAAAGADRLVLSWQLLRLQFGWFGVGLALVGLLTLWRRRQFDLLLLTGLSLLGFVVFNITYFIGDIFVLFIPAWLIVSWWIGLGVLGLSHWLAAGFVRSKTRSSELPALGKLQARLRERSYQVTFLLIVAGLFVVFVVLIPMRNPMIDQSNNTSSRDRWLEILTEPLPQGAILVSNDRNEMMPMWYFQYVEGRRPDLLGLFPLIVADPAYTNVGRVLDRAFTSERPVYLIKPMAGLGLKADLVPVGSLFRASPIDDLTPSTRVDRILPELVISQSKGQHATETVKLLGYDIKPAQVTAGGQITVTLYWQAVQSLSIDYTSYVHVLNKDGQGITQSDHRPGGDFYPSSHWQSGEVLRDQHPVALPAELAAGLYQLRVGLYYQPEPGVIEGMGAGEAIGPINVSP